MFWTVLALGMLVNGIAVGGSLWARAHGEPTDDVGPLDPCPPASPRGHGAGIHTGLTMLHLANAALARSAHADARVYAERAVSTLEQSGASPAHLTYARRVLRQALWPGQNLTAC